MIMKDRNKARNTTKDLFLLNNSWEKTTYPSHNVPVYKQYLCEEN